MLIYINMGNIMGLNNQEAEISSTIPYLKKMERDAKNLVLNIQPPPSNNNAENIFTETENYELYKIFEKNLNVNQPVNEFSDTSPFISSDAYNNLMKNQQGGGDDDSSTSESSQENTSNNTTDIDLVSNSEMSEESENQESENQESENQESENQESENQESEQDSQMSEESEEMVLTDTVKKPDNMMSSDSEMMQSESEMMSSENLSTDSEMSTGNPVVSYLSSSAHSDIIDSSTNITTISIGNRKVLSDSINTSDINMISIEE